MQQRNINQHIYFIEIFLSLLSLLESFIEIGESLVHFVSILREKHAHIVVREEGLGVDGQRGLVTFQCGLFVSFTLLDYAKIVENSNLAAKHIFKSHQGANGIFAST